MFEIEGLQKTQGNNTVFDIQELAVSQGEIAAIVGPVGSGKSQLFEILIGKTRPSVGSVKIARRDPTDRETISYVIGVLFSENCIYTRQTVWQNLVFQSRLYGIPNVRVEKIIAQIGLVDHEKTQGGKLSSGLGRRLAFGRAILHEPKVLILVESFNCCDETSISLLTNLMHQQAEEGCSILVEDVTKLHAACKTIFLIDRGRVTEYYHPGEGQGSLPFKIPVRLEGKVALINPVDILYADAAGGRAYLQTRTVRLPTQFTLSELDERSACSGFFRAHRSYLVNLQHVKEVIPYTRNSFSLRLNDDDSEIPLSKSTAGELSELL